MFSCSSTGGSASKKEKLLSLLKVAPQLSCFHYSTNKSVFFFWFPPGRQKHGLTPLSSGHIWDKRQQIHAREHEFRGIFSWKQNKTCHFIRQHKCLLVIIIFESQELLSVTKGKCNFLLEVWRVWVEFSHLACGFAVPLSAPFFTHFKKVLHVLWLLQSSPSGQLHVCVAIKLNPPALKMNPGSE